MSVNEYSPEPKYDPKFHRYELPFHEGVTVALVDPATDPDNLADIVKLSHGPVMKAGGRYAFDRKNPGSLTVVEIDTVTPDFSSNGQSFIVGFYYFNANPKTVYYLRVTYPPGVQIQPKNIFAADPTDAQILPSFWEKVQRLFT